MDTKRDTKRKKTQEEKKHVGRKKTQEDKKRKSI
jgi:hypothetical protein